MDKENEEKKEVGLLAYYHAQLREKLKGKVGPFLYRGQEDSEWEFESGATQRIRESKGIKAGQPIGLQMLIDYHKELLETVKVKGWGQDSDAQELSDLELLAKLQHHGAATCLMDFTSRFDVALWFACRYADAEKDGMVFIVGTTHYSGLRKIGPDESKYFIEKILAMYVEEETDEASRFWHWDPEILMGRMLSQNSQFLFGPQGIPEGGFRDSIEIKGKDKKDLLEELEQQQGLRPDTIFSDIQGFADANTRGVSLPKRNFEDYLREGVRKTQEGNFSDAIKDLDKAISLYSNNGDIAAAWFSRGLAKAKNGDSFEEVVEDFKKATELNPRKGVAWFNLGLAKKKLGDPEGARLSLQRALNLFQKQGNREMQERTERHLQRLEENEPPKS